MQLSLLSPSRGALLVPVLALLHLPPAAQAQVFLDNTSSGTLAQSLGSITVYNWNARVFTTPSSGPLTLSALRMGLYDFSGAARDVTIELRSVDGLNNPTGSALVSETFNISLTTAATFYDLDLDDSLWTLSPSITYALVFRSSAPSTTTSWAPMSDSSSPYTMSEGYVFVGNRRSTNAGTTWSNNTFYNSLQITAVPEPLESALIAGTGLLGFAAWRRRNRR